MTCMGIIGCESDPDADIQGIDLQLDFQRVDQSLFETAKLLKSKPEAAFFSAYAQNLAHERDFLYYFAGIDLYNEARTRQGLPPLSEAETDSAIALQVGTVFADSNMLALLDTIQATFPAEFPFEARLTPLFKRYHKYFPEVAIPAIRTHVNGYDPSGRMQRVDQLLAPQGYISIGLHYFMGNNWPYYSPNLPQYIRRRFQPSYLEANIASELAEGTVPQVNVQGQPTLLDHMIREGLKIYLVDQLIPQIPDSIKMAYSAEEMAWAYHFEKDIYKDLAPSLFETDYMAYQKYLVERPFTAEVSHVSAPRLAQFLGWRIVDNYARLHSDLSVADLVSQTAYEEIFKGAKYKPL